MILSACQTRNLRTSILVLAAASIAGYATPRYVQTGAASGGTGTFNAPFATIQAAASIMSGGDTCYVRQGTYYETVRPTNSGTSSLPMVFRNYQSETVTVHGGAVVPASSWSQHSGSIYKATLSGTPRELFADRQYMLRARHPNVRYDRASGFCMLKAPVGTETPPTVSDWNGAILISGSASAWVSTISQPNAYTATAAGILIGPLGLLDAPAEWAYTGGVLYLWTPGGADPRTSGMAIETATRDYGFDLSSRNYIVVKGITLFGTNINMNGATYCTVDGCNVFYHNSIFIASNGFVREVETSFNSKGKGVVLGGNHNTVRNCDIAHAWGDGVTVYGADNTLENCKIGDCDWSGTDCAPVTAAGSRQIVRYNTIYDGGRSVLNHSKLHSSQIIYNDMFGSGWIRYDLAMAYTFGTDGQGTVEAYNWLHEAYSALGSAGIYHDNFSSNHTVHHNVVWTSGTNARFFGLGFNLPQTNERFYNNSFYNLTGGFTVDTASGWTNCSYVNNIYPIAVAHVNSSVTVGNNISDSCQPYTDPEFGDFTLRANMPQIDAGRVVSSYTDGYQGSAPDVGAYESGITPWVPGADFARKVWQPMRIPGQISRRGWKVFGSVGSQWVNMAIDGRMDTRWDTYSRYDSTQQNSHYYQVNMLAPVSYNKILVFAASSPRDCYARSYSVAVYDGVSAFGPPVATGAGTDSVTIITFPTQTQPAFRITQISSPGSPPWGIDEIVVVNDNTPGVQMPRTGVSGSTSLWSRVRVFATNGRLLCSVDRAHPGASLSGIVGTGAYAMRVELADGTTLRRSLVVAQPTPLRTLLRSAGQITLAR